MMMTYTFVVRITQTDASCDRTRSRGASSVEEAQGTSMIDDDHALERVVCPQTRRRGFGWRHRDTRLESDMSKPYCIFLIAHTDPFSETRLFPRQAVHRTSPHRGLSTKNVRWELFCFPCVCPCICSASCACVHVVPDLLRLERRGL